MDEFIDSTICSYSESIASDAYSGVESMTIEDFNLAESSAVGMGAAACGVVVSIAIAGIIRIFYNV